MKIEQNIQSILSDGTFEGSKYFLPKVQLDRKDYVKCNDVLETIGMKWNRGQKAHIGDSEDLEATFRWILESGEVETLKEYRERFQFFPTPQKLAEYLVQLAEIENDSSILEPSAWQWAILWEFPHYNRCFAVELDINNFNILQEKYSQTKLNILKQDFLEYKDGIFDRIIMNPPFANSQDVKHILHAYSLLQEGGTLVSVASYNIRTREWKLYDDLRALPIEWFEVDSGAFKESGTMVNTVILRIFKK